MVPFIDRLILLAYARKFDPYLIVERKIVSDRQFNIWIKEDKRTATGIGGGEKTRAAIAELYAKYSKQSIDEVTPFLYKHLTLDEFFKVIGMKPFDILQADIGLTNIFREEITNNLAMVSSSSNKNAIASFRTSIGWTDKNPLYLKIYRRHSTSTGLIIDNLILQPDMSINAEFYSEQVQNNSEHYLGTLVTHEISTNITFEKINGKSTTYFLKFIPSHKGNMPGAILGDSDNGQEVIVAGRVIINKSNSKETSSCQLIQQAEMSEEQLFIYDRLDIHARPMHGEKDRMVCFNYHTANEDFD